MTSFNLDQKIIDTDNTVVSFTEKNKNDLNHNTNIHYYLSELPSVLAFTIYHVIYKPYYLTTYPSYFVTSFETILKADILNKSDKVFIQQAYSSQTIDSLSLGVLLNQQEAVQNYFNNQQFRSKKQIKQSIFAYTVFYDDKDFANFLLKYSSVKEKNNCIEQTLYDNLELFKKLDYYPKNIIHILVECWVKLYNEKSHATSKTAHNKNEKSNKDHSSKNILPVCLIPSHMLSLVQSKMISFKDQTNFCYLHNRLDRHDSFELIKSLIINYQNQKTVKKLIQMIDWLEQCHHNFNATSFIFKSCYSPHTSPSMKWVLNDNKQKTMWLNEIKNNPVDIGINKEKYQFVIDQGGQVDTNALIDNLVYKLKRVKMKKSLNYYHDLINRIKNKNPDTFKVLMEDWQISDIILSRSIPNSEAIVASLNSNYLKDLKNDFETKQKTML